METILLIAQYLEAGRRLGMAAKALYATLKSSGFTNEQIAEADRQNGIDIDQAIAELEAGK